jgi:hypothetical protein
VGDASSLLQPPPSPLQPPPPPPPTTPPTATTTMTATPTTTATQTQGARGGAGGRVRGPSSRFKADYAIGGPLGSGAFSFVYRATHTRRLAPEGRAVAVKVHCRHDTATGIAAGAATGVGFAELTCLYSRLCQRLIKRLCQRLY